MSSELPQLDIKLLRLLDPLYTTRSVTRAAEALIFIRKVAPAHEGRAQAAIYLIAF